MRRLLFLLGIATGVALGRRRRRVAVPPVHVHVELDLDAFEARFHETALRQDAEQRGRTATLGAMGLLVAVPLVLAVRPEVPFEAAGILLACLLVLSAVAAFAGARLRRRAAALGRAPAPAWLRLHRRSDS